MRKLIVSNLVSLDGFFEGRNRELDFSCFHPFESRDCYQWRKVKCILKLEYILNNDE